MEGVEGIGGNLEELPASAHLVRSILQGDLIIAPRN
jgi:hypothetical protein